MISTPSQFSGQKMYTQEALTDTYKCHKCSAKIDPMDYVYYGRLCKACYCEHIPCS